MAVEQAGMPYFFCFIFWSLTCSPLRSFQAAVFLLRSFSSFFSDLHPRTAD